MPDETTFTAEQIALAARELRQAAGADEERFTIGQALSMMSDEIRLLRERGFSDAKIADLLTGFDICVSAADVEHQGPSPRFTE